MISVTRLNNEPIVVNSDLIEDIQGTPDTIITLCTGRRVTVLESVDEVVNRIVAFRSRLLPQRPAVIPILRSPERQELLSGE